MVTYYEVEYIWRQRRNEEEIRLIYYRSQYEKIRMKYKKNKNEVQEE